MKIVYVNDRELKALGRMKQREQDLAVWRFRRKQKTHYKSERLRAFYSECDQSENPVLLTVPFRCFFSYYLYLYLKARCEPYDFDKGRYQFHVSQPVEVNFGQLTRHTQLPLNTIRSAYRELVAMGFLIGADLLKDTRQNVCKRVMVVNDYWLIGYDEHRRVALFNINFTRTAKDCATNRSTNVTVG